MRAASQSRIDRLAFQSEDAEDALVHTVQGFAANEAFQCFQAKRELALSGFFAESAEKLVTLYASPLTEEKKLRQREVLFTHLQEEFRKLPNPVRRNANFASTKLNNAVFLQQFIYLTELALFERVYQQQGQDLRATLSRVTEAAEEGDDPLAEMGRWFRLLENRQSQQSFTANDLWDRLLLQLETAAIQPVPHIVLVVETGKGLQ